MSRLQELIERYCPDGVEHVELGSVCFYPKARVNAENLGSGGYVSVENLAQNFAGRTGTAIEMKPGTAAVEYLAGDILVGNIRPYLKKVWLANTPGGANGDVLVFRIVDRYSEVLAPEFLHALLATDEFIDFDMRYAKGVKMPRGDKKAILKYRIPLPPIEVQREIVRLLDAYTAAHDALVGRLNEEINLFRVQQVSVRNSLIESAIADAEVCKLGDVCQITDGDHQPPPKTDDGIDFVTISCIDENHAIDFGKTTKVSREYYESLDKARVPMAGDVLLTVVGTLGTPVMVAADRTFVVQRHIAILRPTESISQRYLYHYLQWAEFHDAACAAATGAAQKTIGLRYLRGAQFHTPSIETQIELVSQLDELESTYRSLLDALNRDIELRMLQLNEFRNQLLSFPEKAA